MAFLTLLWGFFLTMRLNKHELALKLGCSERSLTIWQNEGLPVLEHGKRGQPNAYDLGAVVRWLRRTGRGMMGTADRPPIDIDALERELGIQSPQPAATSAEVSGPNLAGALALARWDWLNFIATDQDGLNSNNALFHAETFIWFIQFRLEQILGGAGASIAQSIEQIQRGSTDNPAGRILVSTLDDAISNVGALVPSPHQLLLKPELSPMFSSEANAQKEGS